MRQFKRDVKTMSREELEYWAFQFMKHAQRVDEVLTDLKEMGWLVEKAESRSGDIRECI